ncbi:MAG: DNA repair ATPase, partial [Kofleriaceae bacterium]|nr:DNA repair ATPase [Kofleriaceae bacterium]
MDTREASAEDGELEGGNYEVLRGRLESHGRSLAKAVEALNARRQEVFGGSALEVIANERVRTENNCVPRDIVSIGEFLFFGYNVFIGLKSETSITDVFGLHHFAALDEGGFDCSPVDISSANGFLTADAFDKDFSTTYRYARDTKLLQLVKNDEHLLAVFQIGNSHQDIKVFKWNIGGDGQLRYVDDRGLADYELPPAYDFEWTSLGRDDQVNGKYPHFNVCDLLFVDNTGGSITIKLENNTSVGEGVYDARVEEANQTLDDARWAYARLGTLILLRVIPYRETQERFLVINTRTHEVTRIDSIGEACLQLPEDQGIIFPNGFYLQTGSYKTFEGDSSDLQFEKVIRSPNGEDILYIFHRRSDGHYSLFPYNLIRKEVQAPIHCHGYSLFNDGRLVVFRSLSDEPTRVHPMQVWQTPFTSAEFAASVPTDGSFLAKVGNAELVRGISDAFSLCRLLGQAEPTRYTYEDVVATSKRALDAYYWLDHEEVGNLKQHISEINDSVELIIDEFEKVLALRGDAKNALAAAEETVEAMERDLRSEHWDAVGLFMEGLTKLRTERGHLIGLREMRYADEARLIELEEVIVEHFERVSQHCVAFLLRPESLAPIKKELDATLTLLKEATRVSEIDPLLEQVAATSEGLDLLSEVATNLQIDDTTQRTAVLESISDAFAQVNRVRAEVEGARRELRNHEGKAEFGAQFKLLGQAVTSAIALSDTPQRCDDELSRVMVQVEELEAHFAEFDEFLVELANKREDVYEAFSTKRQQLLDARQRKAQNLVGAAERILSGVGRRARALASADEVNAYFAADAMALKIRQICEQLTEIGDAVRGEELLSKLKSTKQDAMRSLRDKQDLFEDGENIIKLGEHRFAVNTAATELNLVPRGDDMALHIGGTDFFEVVRDEEFLETRSIWSQELISETAEVYRGEYLAACLLFDAESGDGDKSLAQLYDALRDQTLGAAVSSFAQQRYEDGYERGIHDADATLILAKVLAMREVAGLLRYPAIERSTALHFWFSVVGEETQKRWTVIARSFGRVREYYSDVSAFASLERNIAGSLEKLLSPAELEYLDVGLCAQYLAEELSAPELRFVASARSEKLRDLLRSDLDLRGLYSAFE